MKLIETAILLTINNDYQKRMTITQWTINKNNKLLRLQTTTTKTIALLHRPPPPQRQPPRASSVPKIKCLSEQKPFLTPRCDGGGLYEWVCVCSSSPYGYLSAESFRFDRRSRTIEPRESADLGSGAVGGGAALITGGFYERKWESHTHVHKRTHTLRRALC